MALLRTHPMRVRSRHREQPVWEIRGAWPAPAKVSGQVTSSGAGSGQLCTPALGWTPRSAGVTRRHTRQRSDLCSCYDGVAVPMISRLDFTRGSSRQMAQLGDDVLSARRPAFFRRRSRWRANSSRAPPAEAIRRSLSPSLSDFPFPLEGQGRKGRSAGSAQSAHEA